MDIHETAYCGPELVMKLVTASVRRIWWGFREHSLWMTALLTVGVFLGLAVYTGINDLVAAFQQFEWPIFLAVLGLSTGGYLIRFVKWEFYLRKIDINLPLRLSALAFFSGLMMVITPGKAGEVWKAWFLREHAGTSTSAVTSVVGAERITDLIALSGLAMLGIAVFSVSSFVVPLVIGMIAGGILLLQWRSFCMGVLEVVAELPRIGDFAETIGRFYESTYTLFQLRPLSVAVLLSIIAWGLEGVALWLVLKGFGVQATILVGLFVFGLGSVVGAMSMLPGGLAAAEASMVGVLIVFGYTRDIATGATLVIRVGTLWYAALLGTTIYLGWKMTR